MKEQLVKVYKESTYKLSGHGPRNLEVLKVALDKIEDASYADIYGKGEVIELFEAKMAERLGKEDAVFFPSGTMAQQIALRMWCDDRQIYRVAYHPLCHLEIHEQDGLKEIHTIETVLLGEKNRLFDLADLKAVKEPLAAILIELPQREIGGQLPSFEDLLAITDYCRSNHIHTHLDGARLWECEPYYKKELEEICDLFDSVYVSLYKGIGSLAGAVLAGTEAFTTDSKIWKRRYGGDLISLYPYILSADYYYEKRKGLMDHYYKNATALARRFNSLDNYRTVPLIPVTNMFHVHMAKSNNQSLENLMAAMEISGIGVTAMVINRENEGGFFEVSIGDAYDEISDESLAKLFEQLE